MRRRVLRPYQRVVLDRLASRDRMSIVELREVCDMPHATTLRAARTLCEMGYASEPQEDGPRVFEITQQGRREVGHGNA